MNKRLGNSLSQHYLIHGAETLDMAARASGLFFLVSLPRSQSGGFWWSRYPPGMDGDGWMRGWMRLMSGSKAS